MIGTSSGGSVARLASAKIHGLRQLHGHVLDHQRNSQDQGKTEETKALPISVSLELRDEAGLMAALQEIYDPKSPRFHQFLGADEFRARFSPDSNQIEKVKSFLSSKGMKAISIDGNGLLLHAQANVGQLNSAFQTELHEFRDPSGAAFRSPASEPKVPADLPISGIHGLQNLTIAHPHLKQRAANDTAAKAGSGPSGGYSPSDIRKAYDVPSGLDGSGQILGLFELDGYNASDIAAYENKFGLPATPLQNVLVDGASGGASGGAAEVTLDIELMLAIAPKAQKILVYEGPNSDQGILDTYSRIASDNLAKSVSTSWGEAETAMSAATIKAENTIFMQMAAQGQTIYSAAGDVGAKDDGTSLSVDDPSAQPFVVAVGGTSLTTGSTGGYVSETTWNDGSGAGGGGVSAVWTLPSWQKGIASSANLASSSMRNIPDVSLNADINTGYSIYTGGSWGVWGGTSASAPLWAAFNALLNQARAGNGFPSVGYITPLLYAIGKSPGYLLDFFDIADGSTNQYYPAASGYDDATGWGSFKASQLIQDLSRDSGNPVLSNACAG